MDNGGRKETRKKSNHRESMDLRRNLKMKGLEGVNHDLRTLTYDAHEPMTLMASAHVIRSAPGCFRGGLIDSTRRQSPVALRMRSVIARDRPPRPKAITRQTR